VRLILQDWEMWLFSLIRRNKQRKSNKMRRQRNMLQTKEQGKTYKLNEMEISNLSNKDFKVMVIKMLPGLERIVDELSENFNKGRENIKKNQ